MRITEDQKVFYLDTGEGDYSYDLLKESLPIYYDSSAKRIRIQKLYSVETIRKLIFFLRSHNETVTIPNELDFLIRLNILIYNKVSIDLSLRLCEDKNLPLIIKEQNLESLKDYLVVSSKKTYLNLEEGQIPIFLVKRSNYQILKKLINDYRKKSLKFHFMVKNYTDLGIINNLVSLFYGRRVSEKDLYELKQYHEIFYYDHIEAHSYIMKATNGQKKLLESLKDKSEYLHILKYKYITNVVGTSHHATFLGDLVEVADIKDYYKVDHFLELVSFDEELLNNDIFYIGEYHSLDMKIKDVFEKHKIKSVILNLY